MTECLFRLRLPTGATGLARGDTAAGPVALLPSELTLEGLLRRGPEALLDAIRGRGARSAIPPEAALLAPLDAQEVWGAGVTYLRSRDARMEESQSDASVYDRVYGAARPELFFKAPAWRVRGPGQEVGIRADSQWNVPEPELALVVTPALSIAGYTIGNDVSSRSIEGENPLYLPQAKIYDASCALGPGIVPAALVAPPFPIHLAVLREGTAVLDAETTTSRMTRSLEELVEHAGRALTFPSGLALLTGTGIVPEPSFTLEEGDVVRIEAGALGVLENPVVTVGRPAPEASRAGKASPGAP
ncbi:MAG: fumarylacetoacetate hydrolase family protein [Chloroflexota bacterium]|nr:fumarylacetoacetate hydrolase family protein [Chloroflexota bacterium]